MTKRDHEKPKIRFLGSFLLIVILTAMQQSCSFQKRGHANCHIDYHVFDSLENYLAEQIKNDKNTVLFINPKCDDCLKKVPGMSKGRFMVKIHHYDSKYHYHQENIVIARSNRSVLIDNITYPVYVLGVDNYFTALVDSQSRESYKKYQREGVPIDEHAWILVDIEKKLFYLDNGNTERGRLKK